MASSCNHKKNRLGRGGQVLIEYLLLMVIVVGISTLMTKLLVDRSNDNQPGIIIGAWNNILIQIGRDVPDCISDNCTP